jgi:hypothetical protein
VEGRSLAAAIALAVLIVIAAGTALLFAGGPPPAPPRPRAPSPSDVSEALKLSATVYRATLEQDSRIYGVPPMRPEEMARPFSYFDEGPAKGAGAPPLKVGASIQTPHLKLSLIVRKEAGSMEGQTFHADHLVLRIENLTDRDLAYRVETRVADEPRCDTKGEAPHNAIVLAPHETAYRTECLYRKDQRVAVRSIEVMEIPKLSAYYVSRLSPGLVLYSPRTSAGHVPPKGGLCPQTFSWREIRDGADRGEIGWRDVIDFYARHNCEDYVFFGSYRYRTDAAAPLPAHATP